MAKIVVIAGSVRSERQGIKVANWIVKYLKKRNHAVNLIDPLDVDLPLIKCTEKMVTLLITTMKGELENL